MQPRQINIIEGGVVDVFEIFAQKLLVPRGVVPPFVGDNVRAGVVEPRVNNGVKFPYSLGPALRGGCQPNNCYYPSKNISLEQGCSSLAKRSVCHSPQ